MMRRSSTVILSATITLAIFVAVSAFIVNPNRGGDNYSSQVLEEAQNRQTLTVANVPEPLETDVEARKDEDKMAEKVSTILKEDDDFSSTMGEKSTEYVISKMPEIEEKYAQDIDSKIESVKSENSSSIASLEKEVAAAKESIPTDDEIVSSLLSNKEFLDSVTESVKERVSPNVDSQAIAKEIIESDSFKNALKDLISESNNTIPLPEFDTESSAQYTEEEYLKKREEARNTELGRILEFLGY